MGAVENTASLSSGTPSSAVRRPQRNHLLLKAGTLLSAGL